MMPPLKKIEIVGGEDPKCRCRRVNVGRVDEWTDTAGCPMHDDLRAAASPLAETSIKDPDWFEKAIAAGAAYADAVLAGGIPSSFAGAGPVQIQPEDIATRLTCGGCGADVTASHGVGHVCAPKADFIKGLLGQTPPPGRLFEVALIDGEARFQITGLGLGLQLDSVTAQALRDVLEHGIRHCQRIHLTDRAAELVASNGGHV